MNDGFWAKSNKKKDIKEIKGEKRIVFPGLFVCVVETGVGGGSFREAKSKYV